MPRLSALPFELQTLILAKCDTAAICALSRVSKAIRPIAIQALYHQIHWLWQWEPNPPLGLLLRSILERPELALLIKNVRLDVDDQYLGDHSPYYTETYMEDIQPVKLDPQTTEKAIELVRETGFPDQLEWKEALELGSIDALLSLFISQLKSLETLIMGPSLSHHARFMGTMFKHLIKPGSDHFNHLRRIQFGQRDEGYRIANLNTNANQVVPLFYLPSLQELDVTLNDLDFYPWQPVPQFQSLKSLRLWRCNITPAELERLLSLAPALKELHCSFLRDGDDEGEAQVKLHDLQSALTYTARTLETLEVEVLWHSRNGDCTFPLPGRFATGSLSLRSFQAFQRLNVPLGLLMGDAPWHGTRLSTQLPPSLKILSLSDNTTTWYTDPKDFVQSGFDLEPDHSMQDTIDALALYLQDHDHCAPLLKEIWLNLKGLSYKGGRLLESGPNDHQTNQSQPQQLRRIAEASGVSINVGFWRTYSGGRGSSYGARVEVYDREKPEKDMWETEIRQKSIF